MAAYEGLDEFFTGFDAPVTAPLYPDPPYYYRGAKVINYVKLWNVATGALLWTSVEGDLGPVMSIVFSPDGTSIYCCDSSATTRIDAGTGQTRRDLMKATDGPPR